MWVLNLTANQLCGRVLTWPCWLQRSLTTPKIRIALTEITTVLVETIQTDDDFSVVAPWWCNSLHSDLLMPNLLSCMHHVKTLLFSQAFRLYILGCSICWISFCALYLLSSHSPFLSFKSFCLFLYRWGRFNWFYFCPLWSWSFIFYCYCFMLLLSLRCCIVLLVNLLKHIF